MTAPKLDKLVPLSPAPNSAFSHTQLLHSIRQKAAESPTNYPHYSQSALDRMRAEFTRRNPGQELYGWHVECGAAILLGLDVTVIAGTNAGKTTLAFLPLLAAPLGEKRLVLLLSPLKLLQTEQCERFTRMGFKAAAVNGDTWSTTLKQKLLLKEYDIIITSPEMALSHTHLRPILANPTVNCDIDLLVVDEAHCTVRWGEDFRVKYSDLTDLRRLLPARTSCLAMSATMPPEILAGVRNVLSIDEKHSYHINLGNDRRNIAQIVVPLKQNESLLEQLAVLLCNLQPDKRGHLVRALCFFGSRATTQQASAFVKRKLRDSGLDLRVHYIHAGLTPKARAEIMRRFVNHQIDILFATDAVGSGQNLADIEVVVVVDRPSGSKSFKLPELLQWLGRAGRDNQPARGYIMAEWTLFQRVKPRKPKNEDVDRTVLSMQDVLELDSDNSDGPTAATSGLVHRKKIDPHLRAYFKATSCRRAFLNQHFENRCCVRRKSVMSLTGFA